MAKPTGRTRRPKNTVTTKSGNTIKVNRSISDRRKSRKAGEDAAKAAYLATLPKERWKRTLYRMHPKRVAQYWFSRRGGIMALKIIGISIIAGFFMTIGLFAYFRKDLPDIKDLSGNDLGGNITYYDRTGQTLLFNDYNAVKRIGVNDQEISPFMKQATVAIEDKDFFKHGAFDTRGIARAAYKDVTGGSTQGGSTITQQLVKLNQNWTDNRTVTRKVKELILAVELEREYSKKDILNGYLNIAPYGGQIYGVESAARDYFKTTAKDLSLAQATMLAAIPQSPSFYSPYSCSRFNPAVSTDGCDFGALIGRQQYILEQMRKQGYITKAQADEAKATDVLAQVQLQEDKYKDIKAPYFVQAARKELMQTYGDMTVQRGGWKVITTLDMNLQNKAEELVASNLANAKRFGADQEAVVMEDVQTGQIVSLVGGTDFYNKEYGQRNYASSIKIPPGSSIKPYDYAALINNNNNVGAGSIFYDTQGALPAKGYECTRKQLPKNNGDCLVDYDFKYPGAVTLRYALGGSRNVPAVKAMLATVPNDKSENKVNSINKTIETASAMMANRYNESKKRKSYNCYADVALTQPNQCGASSALGDGAFLHLDDHVNGLSTFARLGNAIPRTYILKITDSAQKNLYEFKQPKGKQAIKPDTAYIVNDMASDYKASYLPGSCTETNCTPLRSGGFKFQRFNGWKFAAKTGTTNDGYDGLMTAWSSKYAVVTWVGHHDRNVTLRTDMERLTAPLARGMMEFAHTNQKAVNWTPPTGLKTTSAFVVRNHIGIGSIEPSPTNDLYPSWYVGGSSANKKNTSTTIDRVSNKTATSCTPALAKQTASNANAASWNVDIFNGGMTSIGSSASGGSGTTSAANDDVHNCNDSPPTVTLTTPDNCDTSCTITATVTQGTHPLTDPQYAQFPGTVTFTLGGQTIYSAKVTDSPSTVSFPYTATSNGSGTVTATVTDSVLYSGSASRTMSYSVPVAAGPTSSGLSGFTANIGGNFVIFNWSGGRPGYTVTRSDNNIPLCQNVNDPTGCKPSKLSAPAGTSVTLRDADNNSVVTIVGN